MITKRSFLSIAALHLPLLGSNAFAAVTLGNELYADQQEMDTWMHQWMDAPGAVAGALHLGRFADRVYYLTDKIGWSPNSGQQGESVNVPVGFVTDFASVPRVFWSILPPDGQYTFPAIIHDYLYWEQSVERSQADEIFRYAMEDFEINKVTIKTIIAGVKAGGGFAWRNNAELKESGEKRILNKYPTEPTTKWIEWKKDSTVF